MAKTLKGRTVWIACTSAGGTIPSTQNSDIANAGAYAALLWTQIKQCGALGESGSSTNMPAYDQFDTDVTQKGKGITDAGNPTLEMSYSASDAGQTALRAAALTNNNYAFKWLDDDNVVFYNRGLVTGPTHPGGRNEDFRLDVFTIGCNQREIIA